MRPEKVLKPDFDSWALLHERESQRERERDVNNKESRSLSFIVYILSFLSYA